jgi:hypothetical protein
MICRHCGTEIADKAIVCYRCGTGTTEPLRKPAEIRRRRSPAILAILFVIVLILVLYLLWQSGLVGVQAAILEDPRISAVLIDFAAGYA